MPPARAFILALALACFATSGSISVPPTLAHEEEGGATSPSGTDTPTEPAGPTVRGVVRDNNGRPVAAATVRALPSDLRASRRDRHVDDWVDPVVRVSTDDGSFVVDGLGRRNGSTFHVRVEAAGHSPITLGDIPAEAALSVSLKPGSPVTGQVVSARTGAPISGAAVTVCDREARRFGRNVCPVVSTNDRGMFSLKHAAARTEFHAVAAGFAARTASVRLPRAEDAAEIVLRLAPGARVSGEVVDQDGLPVEGASVRLLPRSQGMRSRMNEIPDWPVFSGADGRFTIAGAPAATAFQIRASRDDRASLDAGSIELVAGKDVDNLRIPLVETADLIGRLVDEDDRPVQGMRVEYRDTVDENGRIRRLDDDWVESAADGSFLARLPRSANYDVFLVPDLAAEVVLEGLELTSGRSHDVDTLVVVVGTAIEGNVNGSRGEPIATAKITAAYRTDAGLRRRRANTDERGRFRIVGLGHESVSVSVEADGYLDEEVPDVEPGRIDVDFWLEPTGKIEGRVRRDDGDPLERFAVITFPESVGSSLTRRSGSTKQETFRAEDGHYSLDGLAAGRYTVEARARGFAPARHSEIEVVAGRTTTVPTLTLGEGLTLRGRVVTLADERPIAEARVSASGGTGIGNFMAGPVGSGVTDADGSFEIVGLEPGARTVRAEHSEYAPAEQRVQLSADEPNAEILLRLSGGGSLEGTVRRADSTAAEGRTVMASSGLDVADARRAETGADGRYRFRRLKPGRYQVMLISGGGAAPKLDAKAATVQDGETTVVDFDEGARILVGGRVLRGDEPVPRARLLFVPIGDILSPDISGMTQADANGNFEVGLDQAGAYGVMVDLGDGVGTSSVQIDVPDEAYVTRDIRLEVDGVSGKVVDEEGQPVPGAEVTAQSNSVSNPGISGLRLAVTDEAGRFSMQDMESGSYTVTAIAPGFQAGTVPVQFSAGSRVDDVEIRLTPGKTIRGRITDPSGNGIAAAQILASPAGSGDPLAATAARTLSDAGGNFRLSVPAEGPIDLTALSDNWAPARLDQVVPTGDDEEELLLTATRGGSVGVLVLDAGGRPVPGRTVEARPRRPYLGSALMGILRPPRPTRTDGSTVLEHLAAGAYEVHVLGVENATAEIVIADGAEGSVLLRLP